MDSKARVSDVILLISAIIALAIFLVILFIIGGPVPFHPYPALMAAGQLKDAWNKVATPITSPSNVIFNTSQNQINSIALATNSKVGISADQICLSRGDFSDSKYDAIFEINDAKTSINYNGSGNKDARISVYCYTGKELVSTLERLGSDISPDWASDCACTESEKTCCLIALRFGK